MTTPTTAAALELEAFLRILVWLDSDGRASRQGQQKADAQHATNKMQNAVTTISDAELASIVSTRPEKGDLGDKWVFCRRGYGDDLVVVPAVTARWDFTTSSPMIHVMVMFGSTWVTPAGKRVLVSYLYRFETGEDRTAHDYHHAQPSRDFKANGPGLPGVRPILNVTTPAFPLDASGPVGVAMCAVRAIFSSKGFRRLMSDNEVRRVLQPFLSQMPAYNQNVPSPQGSGVALSVSPAGT